MGNLETPFHARSSGRKVAGELCRNSSPDTLASYLSLMMLWWDLLECQGRILIPIVSSSFPLCLAHFDRTKNFHEASATAPSLISKTGYRNRCHTARASSADWEHLPRVPLFEETYHPARDDLTPFNWSHIATYLHLRKHTTTTYTLRQLRFGFPRLLHMAASLRTMAPKRAVRSFTPTAPRSAPAARANAQRMLHITGAKEQSHFLAFESAHPRPSSPLLSR